MSNITDEKIAKYFSVTEQALAMAKRNISIDKKKDAGTILDIASRYVSDAKHFLGENDKVNAFAALNYAHGWLDCGAMLKFFDVKDNALFTVDDS